jgi:hypothetical protein
MKALLILPVIHVQHINTHTRAALPGRFADVTATKELVL